MDQEQLTKTIAENLTKYRKAANMTQLEVAEKLNYSDKSVSKWEQGNGVPDVYVLCRLAEMYSVTVNDILYDDPKKPPKKTKKHDNINRNIIISMSVGLCWLIAVLVYVFPAVFGLPKDYTWLAFIDALPVSAIVVVVFSSVWKFYLVDFIAISCLVWTLLLALFFTLQPFFDGAFMLFFIGIPLQILVLLWAGFKFHILHLKKDREKEKTEQK